MKNLTKSADSSPYITALDEYKNAETVFTYVSVGAEADTRLFIGRAICDGKTVCVPRCGERERNQMQAIKIASLDALTTGRYGIPEPQSGEVVPFSEIDFAVIPCLCADSLGNRLGHGAGYYDRFLVDFHGFSLVLCRQELKVDAVPTEAHDIPANKVIFI